MPRILLALLTLSLALVLPQVGRAQMQAQTPEALLTSAEESFQRFLVDPEMTWFRDNLPNARGVLIVPRYLRAGFLVGGAGGRGVLVAREKDGPGWLGPVFYYLGSASLGVQIGVDLAEVVLLVMTDQGVDRLLGGDLKLGADARVAAGPVGVGTGATTADIVSFSRSRGLFAGIALDGGVINPSGDFNQAFYGQAATPADILVRRAVPANPAGDPLVRRVEAAAAPAEPAETAPSETEPGETEPAKTEPPQTAPSE
jgi:lipid-binding SYLF domain-containing protein